MRFQLHIIIAFLGAVFFTPNLALAITTNAESIIATAPNGATISLEGYFEQGGLVKGTSDKNIKAIKIGTVKVPVHPNKRLFAFGFGRDEKPNDTLSMEFEDGTKFSQALTIKQREYQTERITGVEKKYVSPPKAVTDRIKSDAERVYLARQKMSYRSDFLSPIQRPAEGRFSGFYGSQRVFNGVPKRPHFGLDIAAPTGTPVVAPWSGVVVFADKNLYYSGGTLIIDHGLGITSTYIHLSQLNVVEGAKVKQGEKIAEIGATGRVTGPHLDWRINWFNRRLDPGLLLGIK